LVDGSLESPYKTSYSPELNIFAAVYARSKLYVGLHILRVFNHEYNLYTVSEKFPPLNCL